MQKQLRRLVWRLWWELDPGRLWHIDLALWAASYSYRINNKCSLFWGRVVWNKYIIMRKWTYSKLSIRKFIGCREYSIRVTTHRFIPFILNFQLAWQTCHKIIRERELELGIQSSFMRLYCLKIGNKPTNKENGLIELEAQE